jgi:hypothetical protein
VAGDAALTMDDDLVLLGQGVTIQVALIGNTPPTIAVGGDMVLQGNTSLEIDTSAWTSGGPVQIFAVDGNIVGDFTSVTVNGSPLDPANYLRTSSGISIHLGEPSGLILVGLAGLGAGFWRRFYRRNHRP